MRKFCPIVLLLLILGSVGHGFWISNQGEEEEGSPDEAGSDLKGKSETEEEVFPCFPNVFNPGY